MGVQAAVLSVVIALVRRGSVWRLVDLLDRTKQIWLIFASAAIIVAQSVVKRTVATDVWMPLTGWLNLAASVAILLFALFNLKLPGMKLFLVGMVLNFLPMAANGGKMPVSDWAARVAKTRPIYTATRHVDTASRGPFYFLADVIPVTRPPSIVPMVTSPGDILTAIGIFVLIQATMCGRKNGGRDRRVENPPSPTAS